MRTKEAILNMLLCVALMFAAVPAAAYASEGTQGHTHSYGIGNLTGDKPVNAGEYAANITVADNGTEYRASTSLGISEEAGGTETPEDPLPVGYDIWVNGIEVTSANKDDVLSEADGTGASVIYNADTKTLTLDHINLAESDSIVGLGAIIASFRTDAINIHLKGANTLAQKGEGSRIFNHISGQGDLTITGDEGSSLKIENGDASGIHTVGRLTIDGTAIDISLAETARRNVLYGERGISIQNSADVTVKTGLVPAIAGCEMDIAISDSKVTASSIQSRALACELGITITGSTVIADSASDADAEITPNAPAISGRNISIEDSIVEVSHRGSGRGISSGGNVNISQAAGTTSVTVSSNAIAVAAANGAATISGGTVNLTSEAGNAVYVGQGLEITGDSMVTMTGGEGISAVRLDNSSAVTVGSGLSAVASADRSGASAAAYVAEDNDSYSYVRVSPDYSVDAPTIARQPESADYCPGDVVAALTVTADASDGMSLTYQWYSNTSDSTTGGTLVGTGTSYEPSSAKAGDMWYYCVVTNTKHTVNGTETVATTSNTARISIGHKLDEVTAVTATCTTDGSLQHWKCSACSDLFADAGGNTPTTAEAVRIAADHKWGAWTEVNDKQHRRACQNDSGHTETADHAYKNGVCDYCGRTDGDVAPVTKYTLTVTNGTGGGTYEANEQVSISADTAPAGKEFDRWTTGGGGSFADAYSKNTTFTMPADDVAITAVYKDKATDPVHTHSHGPAWKSDSTGHWHECSCGDRADHAAHTPGAPATADTPQTCSVCGYVIQPATGGGTTQERPWPFIDVAVIAGHWKYEAVKYVYENDIMGGVGGSNQFQPDHPLTRAMFATVLYRMAGEPEMAYRGRFSDVADGMWYSKAILWANEKGIVDGYTDGSYGINNNITREQIAKMLCLYGEFRKYDVSGKALLQDFTDDEMVSGWAVGFMEWAVDAKMITGKPNGDGSFRLDPKGEATRAECAKMLKMFEEKYK